VRVVEEPFPERISAGSVVAIGKFDGVHAGHRAVIGGAVERAAALGLESVVLTFDRNPYEVVRPATASRRIFDLPARLALIERTGVDLAVVLRFDHERAEQSAQDFARVELAGRLAARAVYVGEDFFFGRRGHGDVPLLRSLGAELGFEVVALPLVPGDGQAKVSSTRIRERILAGEVRIAAELLGAPVTVGGVVVHGEARGRELGFPTANLRLGEFDIVPADGVYAGWAVVDGVRHPAAISVSDNPTFGDVAERRVEAFLLDAALDLYGRRLTIEFVDRVRGIERFESVDALIGAMRDDVTRTRAILGLPAAG